MSKPFPSPEQWKAMGGPVVEADSWPAPQPIPSGRIEVPPFNFDMLPDALRPWIADIAERIQCPPDFVAVGAMVSLASVVGRRIAIRPKRKDDWFEVANSWGGIIGRPGLMKTPALAEAMKPFARLEAILREEAKKGGADSDTEQELMKSEARTLRKKAEKAIASGDKETARECYASAKVVETKVEDLEGAGEFVPTLKVNDASVEALGEVLAKNPNGVLLFRDELVGWLRSLDRDGAENARPFYLEAWGGKGSYDYHRIGRGHIHIEAACVSILGGIQPGPLAEYVRDAQRNGSGADGLLQRFQLLVWPDDPGGWRNVDRWPDTEAKNRAFHVFERLYRLEPVVEAGAQQDPEEAGGIPFLRFDTDAQRLFEEWRHELENVKLRAAGSEALESHLSKYRKLVPSLALVLHLADAPNGGPLSELALLRAIAWAEYLEGHAKRIYGLASDAGAASARALVAKIKTGEVADGFLLRDVYRNHWRNLSRPEVEEGAELLEELDWLRAEMVPTTGRPKTCYRINPRFREVAV